MSTPLFSAGSLKKFLGIFLSTHINVKGIEQKTGEGLFSPLPGEWVPIFEERGKGVKIRLLPLPYPLTYFSPTRLRLQKNIAVGESS